MKMKSIFLSMLAIAALASCTQENFNVDPPGPQGNEMTIDLTIGGASLTSKAAGVATNATDKAIDNLTVFGVNAATGAIITKKYFGYTDLTAVGETDAKKVTFTTTDQTTEIHAIANIGEDLTGSGKALNVGTLKSLQNVKASLIVSGGAGGAIPKQTEGKVLMSGFTSTISPGADGVNPAAAVDLDFIASKIILKSLSRDASSTGAYKTNFQLKNAIMSNVQTSAYYVRGNSSYVDAIGTGGATRSAITPEWATGRTDADEEAGTKVADFSQSLSSIATFDAGGTAVEDIAYWYVFENPDASKKTTLLIEYVWKKTGTGDMNTTMYFPVTFGADAATIEPGKAYNVSITFHGNFLPEDDPTGGGGGGGTDDPDKPIVPGNVDVTVTPAQWTPENSDKDFGKN